MVTNENADRDKSEQPAGTICARCGETALGFATINDSRYCHANDRSCYSEQCWDDTKALEQRLDELAPVHIGWIGYEDGSLSPVERWVRASDGDWISLDSTRRTSRDIIPQHFSSVPDWRARAEAAEATVMRVKALADEWDDDVYSDDYPYVQLVRAALDGDVPELDEGDAMRWTTLEDS